MNKPVVICEDSFQIVFGKIYQAGKITAINSVIGGDEYDKTGSIN